MVAMPSLEEAPAGFASPVIWHFRLATLGTQAVLWITLGLGFGAVAERALSPASTQRRRALARGHGLIRRST